MTFQRANISQMDNSSERRVRRKPVRGSRTGYSALKTLVQPGEAVCFHSGLSCFRAFLQPPNESLYVGQLGDDVDRDALRSAFSKFGHVQSVYMCAPTAGACSSNFSLRVRKDHCRETVQVRFCDFHKYFRRGGGTTCDG